MTSRFDCRPKRWFGEDGTLNHLREPIQEPPLRPNITLAPTMPIPILTRYVAPQESSALDLSNTGDDASGSAGSYRLGIRNQVQERV